MGARHLVVVNGELGAVGIITRADMNEHRLAHFWHEEVSDSTVMRVVHRAASDSLYLHADIPDLDVCFFHLTSSHVVPSDSCIISYPY